MLVHILLLSHVTHRGHAHVRHIAYIELHTLPICHILHSYISHIYSLPYNTYISEHLYAIHYIIHIFHILYSGHIAYIELHTLLQTLHTLYIDGIDSKSPESVFWWYSCNAVSPPCRNREGSHR